MMTANGKQLYGLDNGSIRILEQQWNLHDDVIKWKHFPRNWPFVRGIHRSPVNSPHKGQWRRALMFSLICALNKRLSKQSWGWWFKTPSRLLWRHCNVERWSLVYETLLEINDSQRNFEENISDFVIPIRCWICIYGNGEVRACINKGWALEWLK